MEKHHIVDEGPVISTHVHGCRGVCEKVTGKKVTQVKNLGEVVNKNLGRYVPPRFSKIGSPKLFSA